MGRIITSNSSGHSKTPFVVLTSKVGASFTGTMHAKATEAKKVGMSEKYLYGLAVVDGDMPIQIKNDAGQYVEATVAVGDRVTIFASSILHRLLEQVGLNETVKITFLGKEKSQKGNMFNNFQVEVI